MRSVYRIFAALSTHRIFAALFVLAVPLTLFAQPKTHRAPIGLRDMVGAGLHVGLPAGLRMDLLFLPIDSNMLAIEGYYGATGGTWGLGESYAALLRLDVPAIDDRVNDAMIVSPGVGIATMLPSDPFRGWWDWSPYETVHSVLAVCEVTWVHEFKSWSLELGIAPGENYAFDGRDKNNQPAKGLYSFQLSAIVGARFLH